MDNNCMDTMTPAEMLDRTLKTKKKMKEIRKICKSKETTKRKAKKIIEVFLADFHIDPKVN